MADIDLDVWCGSGSAVLSRGGSIRAYSSEKANEAIDGIKEGYLSLIHSAHIMQLNESPKQGSEWHCPRFFLHLGH
jgi:hypothetical protein